MTPKPATRRSIPRHRSADYWKVANHLMESARALLTLGDTAYGNAIGICVIHAAISANDAVTIGLGGVRSSSEKHTEALRLLKEVVPDAPDEVVRAFTAVLQSKTAYEYTGDVYTPATARKLLNKADIFYQWAAKRLQVRPPVSIVQRAG